MKKNSQKGFSLIEMLIVVTIIGIIAALGVPSLQKGIRAADNGSAYATLRAMSSSQVGYFVQHNRFARLGELNAQHKSGFGTTIDSGRAISKGRFIFEMTPINPSDADLKDFYTVVATGVVAAGETPYIYRVDQTGEIIQVTP